MRDDTLERVVEDLRTVAAWTCGVLGAGELRAALRPAGLPWPAHVSRAIDRLLDTSAAAIAGDRAAEHDLAGLLTRLLGEFPPREGTILRDRILSMAPHTQSQLAARCGVSRQRISQQEIRAVKRLDTLLKSGDAEPLRWRASVLRTVLRDAIPLESPTVRSEFRRLRAQCGATIGPARVRTHELLLHIAGPYELDEGWLIRRDRAETLHALEASLLGAAGAEGLVAFDEAARILDPHIRAEWRDLWIAERTRLVGRPGRGYVDDSGGLLEKARRALLRLGRPATLDELQREMGTSYRPVAARSRLGQSGTIKRVGRNAWGLRDWHHDEYRGIAEEIAREIEACGGTTTLARLAEVLPRKYGVAAGSVRSFAQAPRFVVAGSGLIRLRRPEEPSRQSRRTLPQTRRCYRSGDAWAIRLAVDHDIVRGSGVQCPVAFGRQLAVRPGGRRVIASPGGQTLVTWHRHSTTGPHFGSLRAVAARLGCELGDWLFLRPESDRLAAWSVSGTAVEAACGPARAVLLTGGQPADQARPRRWLARALALKTPASYGDIAATLRRRGEPDIAGLLPDGDGSGA